MFSVSHTCKFTCLLVLQERRLAHAPTQKSAEVNHALKLAMIAEMPTIVQSMSPAGLVANLLASGLFNKEDEERMQSYPTTSEKNRFIIMNLGSKGALAHCLLLDCLKKTARDNPSHGELAKLFEDKLKGQ